MLISLFSFVWRKWIGQNKVVHITGWRSCLYDEPLGQRVRATFLVWPWEKSC